MQCMSTVGNPLHSGMASLYGSSLFHLSATQPCQANMPLLSGRAVLNSPSTYLLFCGIRPLCFTRGGVVVFESKLLYTTQYLIVALLFLQLFKWLECLTHNMKVAGSSPGHVTHFFYYSRPLLTESVTC